MFMIVRGCDIHSPRHTQSFILLSICVVIQFASLCMAPVATHGICDSMPPGLRASMESARTRAAVKPWVLQAPALLMEVP